MKLFLFGIKAFLVIVGGFLLLEYSARVYIYKTTAQPIPIPWLDEGKLKMESYGIVFSDYNKNGFSIKNGERQVTDVPVSYKNTIFLLGNSGIFDPFSSDHDTMASVFQRKLNLSGYKLRVRNLSMTGQGIYYHLGRLKNIKLMPGDVVVLMDYARANEKCEEKSKFDNLALYHVLCEYFPDFGAFERQRNYDIPLSKMEDYTKENGAKFYHVGQACNGLEVKSIYRLVVDSLGVVDGCHLNSYGDKQVGDELFNYLTLI